MSVSDVVRRILKLLNCERTRRACISSFKISLLFQEPLPSQLAQEEGGRMNLLANREILNLNWNELTLTKSSTFANIRQSLDRWSRLEPALTGIWSFPFLEKGLSGLFEKQEQNRLTSVSMGKSYTLFLGASDFLTKHFTIQMSENPAIVAFCLVQKRQSADFEALKLWNVWYDPNYLSSPPFQLLRLRISLKLFMLSTKVIKQMKGILPTCQKREILISLAHSTDRSGETKTFFGFCIMYISSICSKS